MDKKLTIFLLTLSISLIFAGAVSAAATIDVYYTDSQNNQVDHVPAGTAVASNIIVSNDENQLDDVLVEQTYHNNNQWTDDEHYYVSLDGGETWITDPASVIPYEGGFTWEIGTLLPNQIVILRWPGIPVTPGSEVMNVELYSEGQLLDSDTTSFTITEPVPGPTPVSADKIPMQNTGSPLIVAFLGLISTIGGTIYAKQRI